MTVEKYGLPPQVFTATPASRDSHSRLAVDVGSTGFFQGRSFRVSYEFDIDVGATEVLKFSAPLDFILDKQLLSADDGSIRFRAFRDSQGSEGGTFDTPIAIFGRNNMAETPDYTRQITISSGGTFTPDGNESPAEVIRIRASSATAQRATVSAVSADERALAAGDYYLLLENIGAGNVTGVYDLAWEERPADLNDWLVKL